MPQKLEKQTRDSGNCACTVHSPCIMRYTHEEQMFILKMYYQRRVKAVIDERPNHFTTQPPPSRNIHYMCKKFEQIGTKEDAPRSGQPLTAFSEKNLQHPG